jgi:uncharacterized protein (TIGR04255 family)
MTVNDTAKYTWHDFRTRANFAVTTLFDAYPDAGELKVKNLILRYIDAVPLDHEREDVFQFLRDKMGVRIALPEALFEDGGIHPAPGHFNWQASFRCDNPQGRATIRFATGKKEETPALMWETVIESAGDDIPDMPDGFGDWLEAAHSITDDWFFKLIEGELERRFTDD